MSKPVSSLAVAVGVGLAVVLVVSGFQTSSASFSATTDNRSNLWEAAELSLTVTDDGNGLADLFLDARGIYPGLEQQNCVLVSAATTLERSEVRLHASVVADDGLGPLYDVKVERGQKRGGCEQFIPEATIYAGNLEGLAALHGSYRDGLVVMPAPSTAVPLRFIGAVEDTNQAQGLAIDYRVFLELKP